MRSLLIAVVDAAAGVLAVLLRPVRWACRPLLRFWRLAQLKSRCSGRVPATLQFDGPVRVQGRPRVSFGDHCRLGRDVHLETAGEARIVVGDHVRINAGCFLVAHAGITIGSHTLIGEYAAIRDANHGTAPDRLIREQGMDAAPITIGEDVWICRGASILKGVRVESGSVVGANSVVTRDVPARSVVAGCPARPLRQRPPAAGQGSGPA